MNWRHEKRDVTRGGPVPIDLKEDFFLSDQGAEVHLYSHPQGWKGHYKKGDFAFDFKPSAHFVGDLQPNWTEEELRYRTSQLGPVCAVYIQKSKLARQMTDSEKTENAHHLKTLLYTLHDLYSGYGFIPVKKIIFQGQVLDDFSDTEAGS